MKKTEKATIKLLAKRNIIHNKIKAMFSLVTIILATSLIMGLSIFESCYKTDMIRGVEGQPQVQFIGVTDEQSKTIQNDDEVASVSVEEVVGTYDLKVDVVDARKMTQLGFVTSVENIAKRADVEGTHILKNDAFINTLPEGGLINSENLLILLIGTLVIIVSALVVYNVFYLAIVSQIKEFGQLKALGMTEKQITRMTKYESKMLCFMGIPVGLIIGSIFGRSFYPNGWSWSKAAVIGIFVSFIVYRAVRMSIMKPTKLAAKVSPINALKFTGDRDFKHAGKTTRLKRKLSPMNIAFISIKTNWRRFAITVVSLGISGLLFTLASVYISSVDVKSIVKKGVFQYGDYLIQPLIEDADEYISEKGIIADIESQSGVKAVKQARELEAVWAYGSSSVEDSASVIGEKDFADITSELIEGDMSYQALVDGNMVLMTEGLEGVNVGDSVTMQLEDKSEKTYVVGGILSESIYSDTALYGGWFVIPEEQIDERERRYIKMTDMIVSIDKSKSDEVEAYLNELMDQNGYLHLTTFNDAVDAKRESFKQVSFALIGITVFLILFSIINFISTVIINLATKKQEFAVLQSIGMKKKEVEKMEVGEGTIIVVGSALITFLLGSILGRIIIGALKNAGMFYLTYSFPVGLFAGYIISLLIISALIVLCIFRVLQKHSIVEQLRQSAI